MKNQLFNIIVLSVVATYLASCASAPASTQKPLAALPEAKASYDEKVQTVQVTQFKGTCPSDSKWEALEWKAIVPMADACVKAKEWHKVEKMGNFLATHAHLTPWGPYFLSVSAESRKDYPRAVWMLELALKKAPKEGLFHYELGRINWDLGEDKEALRHLQLASDLNPTLTDAHWVMGQMAAQRQDFSTAETQFKKALANDPKHLPSLLAMSAMKMNSKDWAKAEEYLNQVVAVNPRSMKARMSLAQIQEEQLKKLPEALLNYKQLKRMNADKKLDEAVVMNLDEKIQVLEKSLAAAPKAAPASTRTPSAEGKKVSQ